jgi:hypothetical protein
MSRLEARHHGFEPRILDTAHGKFACVAFFRYPIGMISVFSFTSAGGHLENEDAFLIQAHPAEASSWLCVLADGQGGGPGGAVAAQLACRTAMDAIAASPPRTVANSSAWLTALQQADAAVEADADAGFTTLIGFGIAGGIVAGASCGDSAVHVLCAGKHHTLTAGQRKNPPVGSGAAFFIPFAMRLASPWKILAMSDGVWKYAGWDRIADSMSHRGGQDLIDSLQTGARAPSTGQFMDDFTVVLIEG